MRKDWDFSKPEEEYPEEYLWHMEEPGVHAFRIMADGRPTTIERDLLGLDPDDPRRVYHRNGNTLDAQRANLYIVDPPPKHADRN